MTCSCENHLEQFACSGVGCRVCVLEEENYVENPEFHEERYCLNCNKKRRIYNGRIMAIDDGKS